MPTGLMTLSVNFKIISLEPYYFELFMWARLRQLTTNILPPVSP